MLRKLLLSLLIVSAVVESQAITWKYGSFHATYKTCKITGWGGNQPTSGKLTIPSTYKHSDGVTYTVNSIAAGALDNLTSVTEITIPSSIRYIAKINGSGGLEKESDGVENFRNCPKLKTFKVDSSNKYFSATAEGYLMDKKQTKLYKVPSMVDVTDGKFTVPATTEYITDGAFCENSTITSLGIVAATDHISPNGGFHEMPKLAAFRVSSNNTRYVVKDGALIDDTFKNIVSYPPARTTKNVTISYAAEAVLEHAFANTIHIKTIQLPKSVTRIEEEAFAGSSLTSVSLPESLKDIYAKAFFKSKVTAVEIPAKCPIQAVDKYLFASCPDLKSITIKSSGAEIPEGFARDCPSLESVSFVSPAAEIRDAAFKNCPSLKSYPFSAVTDMYGDSIFYNTGFETVVFDNAAAVAEIPGTAMFAKCLKLTAVDMSAISVENKYNAYSFASQMINICPNLTEIRLPSVVKFSRNSTNPNIGPTVPLQKLVIGKFSVDESNNYAVVRYYGPGTFSPQTYVKTTNAAESDWVGDSWPLKYLYDVANGARVTPVFYCEAISPVEDYVAADATYYVPGGCASRYSDAAHAGCKVMEMYDFIVPGGTPVSPNDIMRLSITPKQTFVTISSVEINLKSGAVNIVPHTTGLLSTIYRYSEIESVRVKYSANGEMLETLYPVDVFTSAVGDIDDEGKSSLSVHIDGGTMLINGSVDTPSYIVFNAEGRELLSGKGSRVDLSSLASGLYVVIANDRTSQLSDKIMIQ